MENYTKEDIVQALSNISDKSRKRVYVDQRSYLIGILAYRFMITEYAIAKLTGINRHKINYNKRLALDFCKDKSYIENVYVYAQMFPFDFTIIDRISPSKRLNGEYLVPAPTEPSVHSSSKQPQTSAFDIVL